MNNPLAKLLAKRKLPDHSDFQTDSFDPAGYNRTYYSEVMEDEQRLMEWQAGELHDTLSDHLRQRGEQRYSSYLQAGSGPALLHDFALEKYADAIQLTDYIPGNLLEIQKWQDGKPDAHDWRPFIRGILVAEGKEPTKALIKEREKNVRNKIASYGPLDLKMLTDEMRAYKAPLVVSYFVADSATGDKDAFVDMTKNAFNIVEPGGMFVGTYLGGCKAYAVQNKTADGSYETEWVDSADITEADIVKAFGVCNATDLRIRRFETPSLAPEGFDHIFAVTAKAV